MTDSSSHISDEPTNPGGHPPKDWKPISGQPSAGVPAPPPDVDPGLLADYAEFEAWKKAQAERESPDGPNVDLERLVLEIPDGETMHRFELVDITNRDVIAHLQVLVTFADSEMDRAGAIFEALLGPIEYEKLRRIVRPMFRRIALAHLEDPEQNPSVEEVWVEMARTVSAPIMELQNDPKRLDSLRGRSATGPTSSIDSAPTSALPPSS